jgi:uncharacterized protein YkuJ
MSKKKKKYSSQRVARVSKIARKKNRANRTNKAKTKFRGGGDKQSSIITNDALISNEKNQIGDNHNVRGSKHPQRQRASLEEVEAWEKESCRLRLLGRHNIALRSYEKKKNNLAELEDIKRELANQMKSWVYLKDGDPPDIEVSWIINSQLSWKGKDINEEELWIDLPEVDPKRVIELEGMGPLSPSEKEALQAAGVEKSIPDQALHVLATILGRLKEMGFDITNEEFSKNWERNGKKHYGGRYLELKKEAEERWKKRVGYYDKPVKYKDWKPPKRKKKQQKKKGKRSSFFSVFFGGLLG